MTDPAAAALPDRQPPQDRPALPRDESREHMMRREAELSVDQRIELFESLSRDAAWARGAVRIR